MKCFVAPTRRLARQCRHRHDPLVSLDFAAADSLKRRLMVVSIWRPLPVHRLDHTRRRTEEKDTNNDYHDDTHSYQSILKELMKTLLDIICAIVHFGHDASAM